MKPLRIFLLILVLLVGAAPLRAQTSEPVLAQRQQARPEAPEAASDSSDGADADRAEAPADPLDAFTITGQVRHRSEIDRAAAGAPPSLHLLRTRLNVRVQPASDVAAFIQVQDARAFGSGNPAAGRGTLDGSAPALDLHQAYFAVTNLFEVPLVLKVGRQELAYGNQRLIGSVGWSNVGRSFDAGVLSYQAKQARIDVLGARLVDDRVENAAENLIGLYSTWPLGEPGAPKLDVFALYDGRSAEIQAGPDAGAASLARGTVGGRLFGTRGAADFEVEGIYQFGRQARGELERASIGAYLASAEAGVTVGRGRIGGLYTVLSGDGNLGDDRATTFNTLFATNHKFYGFLDVFPFNAAFRPGGLHDAALRTSYAISEAVGLRLDAHHFRLDEDLGAGTALGQEIDLTATLRYNEALGFTGGASLFLAADQAEAALGTDTATWFYVSSVVNF